MLETGLAREGGMMEKTVPVKGEVRMLYLRRGEEKKEEEEKEEEEEEEEEDEVKERE